MQLYRNKFENLEAMDNFLVKIQILKMIIFRNMSRSIIIEETGNQRSITKKSPDLDSFTSEFITVFKNQLQCYRKAIWPQKREDTKII